MMKKHFRDRFRSFYRRSPSLPVVTAAAMPCQCTKKKPTTCMTCLMQKTTRQTSASRQPGRCRADHRCVDGRQHALCADEITVKAGETIRFFARNTGQMKHEMVIGSIADLKSHAEMMRKFPGMEHEEPNMVTLKPGQRGGSCGSSTNPAPWISPA